MRKGRLLLIMGIWIAVLPYLGVPSFWKNILFTISGLALGVWGYFLYKEHKAEETPENFTETE